MEDKEWMEGMRFDLYKALGYYDVTEVEIADGVMSVGHSYESCGSDSDCEMKGIDVKAVMEILGVEDVERLKEVLVERFGKNSSGFDRLQRVLDEAKIRYDYHFH